MKVRLVVVKGRPEGMEIPLPMPQFLIGRDPRCNLRPNSESVSKLHCAILHRKEGVFLRDIQSTNGTFLNNDRIQGEVKVKDGDLVKVGPLVLAVKIDVAEPVAASPPSGDEEDQAVSWLLDFNASQPRDVPNLGSKTTVMDMLGASKPTASGEPAEAKEKVEPDVKENDLGKKPADKSKSRGATPEVAGDLLDKLLSPTRKKKS